MQLKQLFTILVLCLPSWAGISYVNGATNFSSTGVTTLSVTYSPTAGNAVLVFVDTVNTTSGLVIKDSSSNVVTAGNNQTGAAPYIYSSCYKAPAGITGFTATWTTSRAATITAVEYSASGGTASCNASFSPNTGSTASTPITLTVLSVASGTYLIGGLGDGGTTLTLAFGTARLSQTSGIAKLIVGDAVGPGNLTLQSNQSPAGGAIAAMELVFSATSQSSLPLLGVGQ